jgi:hypothetical protein
MQQQLQQDSCRHTLELPEIKHLEPTIMVLSENFSMRQRKAAFKEDTGGTAPSCVGLHHQYLQCTTCAACLCATPHARFRNPRPTMASSLHVCWCRTMQLKSAPLEQGALNKTRQQSTRRATAVAAMQLAVCCNATACVTAPSAGVEQEPSTDRHSACTTCAALLRQHIPQAAVWESHAMLD